MAHRTLSVLLALVVCFAVGANAQCNLMVQDQPQYYTTCPGDNYTCALLQTPPRHAREMLASGSKAAAHAVS